MYEHNALGYWSGLTLFDKGQKQSSTLSCDSSYLPMLYRASGNSRDNRVRLQISNDCTRYIINQGYSKYQRTNGPVNAHLRSAAYTNKHV